MSAAAPQRRPVAVNGRAISHAAIAREAQNHPADAPAQAWIAAARALALRELLLQEVERRGVAATPLRDAEGRVETDEEAAMRALVEMDVRTPEPTNEECRRYYDNNCARFRSPALAEAAHILIAPAGEDDRERAGVRAQALADHLAGRPEDFAALAAEFSDCPSAKTGGALGQFSGGETAPEFEAALASLQPGQISAAAVETRFGFHIVKLGRRIEGRQAPYEAVAERIRAYLGEAVRRRAQAQYVARLAASADLRGVDFPAPSNFV